MTGEAPFPEGEVFSDQSFRKLELSGAEPRGRRFDSCSFRECKITGAAFRVCSFLHCVLEDCDLSVWQVEGLRIIDTRFEGSKLVGVQWTQVKSDPLTSYHFENCVLDYSDFCSREDA